MNCTKVSVNTGQDRPDCISAMALEGGMSCLVLRLRGTLELIFGGQGHRIAVSL